MRRAHQLSSLIVSSAALALLMLGSARAQVPPATPVLAPCGAGWMAWATSVAGTVQAGGLLQGKASVCGYPTADAVLNAVLDTCDAQTAGGCRQATSLKVVWGQGDGEKMNTSTSCESKLPLVVSASCPDAAASQLRAAGVR